MASIRQINQRVKDQSGFVEGILRETGAVIVGQNKLIRKMLIALLSDGHMLIEGVPGLAKTLAVRTLSATINAKFQRIQFTPDLLPADLIGTQIYNPATHDFTPRKGPLFSNIILADEINRAPAKVQSALLESMEERQVTLGDETHPLEPLYMVMATQNPIEQEGTYPLPEAQLDRFMMKVIVDYPSKDEEKEIVNRMGGAKPTPPQAVVTPEVLLSAREVVDEIYVDERIKDYVISIVFATRRPADFQLKQLENLIEVGVSPRGTISLIKASKANAFLNGRGFVTPDDVKLMASDVLRHRLVLSFEAEAERISSDRILHEILKRVEVP